MASENCTNRDLPHDGKLNVLKVIYELILREKKINKILNDYPDKYIYIIDK